MIKNIIYFVIGIFMLSACNKPDRIDHKDSNYIYVWRYNDGDSTLLRYKQPVYREFKIMGGHHKNHLIKVDWNDDGIYVCCQLPYDGFITVPLIGVKQLILLKKLSQEKNLL